MKPSGQTTTFAHDNMSRIVTQTDDVGTISFTYDNGDNPLTVTEGTAVLTRTFDSMGRVTSYMDAAGHTVEYEWDNNGRLIKLTYPDNREVTYTYDRHNRLKTVTDWANRVTTYHWDAAGRLSGIDRPNGTTRTNEYTNGDDVARQRGDGAPQACPKGGLNRVPPGRDKPQLERYYERNGAGILQAYARFGYDLDSRIDWRYRLPKPQEMDLPTFTAVYDDDNRVASWNGQSVTHDDDGNMTFGPLPIESSFVSYNFDARNRLTGVGGVTYTYDSENNRIAKTTADPAGGGTGGTTTYVFDPHGDALPRVLVRERPDESVTYYVYGIGLLYEVDEADNATYYHFDQSGSTIALTDDSGEVTDRIEYTPYGTISHRSGTTDTPFLYAGQFGIQADENGLLHMRARYYSPELKRFINADPAGFDGGMNWYAYANNSPLMYVDPDGEIAFLAAPLLMHAARIAVTHAVRRAAPIVARAVVRSSAQVAHSVRVGAQATANFARTSAAQARNIGHAGLNQANFRVAQVNHALASGSPVVQQGLRFGAGTLGVAGFANQFKDQPYDTGGFSGVDFGPSPMGRTIATSLQVFDGGGAIAKGAQAAPLAASALWTPISNYGQNIRSTFTTPTFSSPTSTSFK